MIFPTPLPDELLPNCDDDDLMCRLQNLYQQFARDLFIAFYAKCSDRERANDAVHEAFLRLYSRGVDEVQHPKSWLLKVGTNWLIDLSRRDKRRARLTSDFKDLAADGEPVEDILDLEEREILRASLRKLRDPDRNILSLKYMMNWSSAEIGQHLGIKADAVDMRLTRARRRLSKMMVDQGFTTVQRP